MARLGQNFLVDRNILDVIERLSELSADDVDDWDSLAHIRLLLTVEKAFKIKFSTSEVGKLQNVGDLVTLIKART